MDTYKDLLEDIKSVNEKKSANDIVSNNVTEVVTDDAIDRLDKKFSLHSKISNFAINLLYGLLATLAGLSLAGYCRLADKIDNNTETLSIRLDSLQSSIGQRIDEEQRFNIQRLDAFLSAQSNNVNKSAGVADTVKPKEK